MFKNLPCVGILMAALTQSNCKYTVSKKLLTVRGLLSPKTKLLDHILCTYTPSYHIVFEQLCYLPGYLVELKETCLLVGTLGNDETQI